MSGSSVMIGIDVASAHVDVAAVGAELPKARMALVLRLESLVRAPGVQLQNAVSLEHMLPQTPPDGSDWLQWFPDEDERQARTHRLANLVPLDRNKNSSASNYDFAKKNVYFKGKGTASPFVLTQEVRSEDKWTLAMLIDRQNRLVGVLKKHWVLEVSPTESVSKAPDTTTAMQGQA